MLRLCGAELVEVPAVPYRNPNNYVAYPRPARRATGARPSRTARSVRRPVRQRRQPSRRTIDTTGPEIWQQTDGKVDGFICAVGTGGTLAGIAMALKETQQEHRDRAAPTRRGPRSTATTPRAMLKSEGCSITEGIGQGRITTNHRGRRRRRAYQIPDEEAVPVIFDLLEHEGLCMGGSTGINVAGAIRLAKDLGPGPHHRHDPLRLRHALSVEAVQPGSSCEQRTCRCRPGWSAVQRDGPVRKGLS